MSKSYNLWTTGGEKPKDVDPYNGYGARDDDRQSASEEDRGQWGSKAEFILSCIGLSVGLGNVWRFPYLAYDNGGAAFVIAYFILQIFVGKPMYFMELVMGQFSARGPTGVWAMNPCAKGIGVSMAIISLDVAIYYNVIMAYTLYYFFASMQTTLPWTVCRPEWINCVDSTTRALPMCTGNMTQDLMFKECRCQTNFTVDYIEATNCTNITLMGKARSPPDYYFNDVVIKKSVGLEPENMGIPSWQLALCLLLSWIIVAICLIKGIKSSGKVVYFTATFPYVILIILLIRGALMDGAIDGVKFFIVPEWRRLLDLKVWVAAAGQMFFSLSVSFGGIIMFGSYNKFKNNVYADSILISLMDLVTSLIAGFVIFTTFGGMAKTINNNGGNVTVRTLVTDPGYGLAFIAYPEALSNLPPAQLWSILFFFMLFTLGLDSEFGLLETLLTCLEDELPFLRKHKSKLCVGIGIACYFLALPCICPGGDYVVSLMDHYGADFSVLFVATCECIAVMWVYGVMNFMRDIEYMLGKRPHVWPFWAFCWAFVAPILIGLLFIYRMVTYTGLTYSDDTPYPVFATVLGWILLAGVICPIPIWFILTFVRAKMSKTDLITAMFKPTPRWRPADGNDRYRLKNDFPMIDNDVGLTNPTFM